MLVFVSVCIVNHCPKIHYITNKMLIMTINTYKNKQYNNKAQT